MQAKNSEADRGSRNVGRDLIPARETRVEIRVVNSRFIATAAPVFSVDEAKAFVARIRAEFFDASHNVPAYLVGQFLQHGKVLLGLHAGATGDDNLRSRHIDSVLALCIVDDLQHLDREICFVHLQGLTDDLPFA